MLVQRIRIGHLEEGQVIEELQRELERCENPVDLLRQDFGGLGNICPYEQNLQKINEIIMDDCWDK